MVASLFICSLCLVGSACGGEAIGAKVDEATKQAKAAADQAVIDAEAAAKKAASDAATSTKSAFEAQSKRARDWVDKASENADMSQEALEALKSAGSGVASLFESTTQMAPAAIEIGRVLYDAYDKDIDFDPIWRKVDTPEAQAALDATIGEMPRVEMIDGLKVGFKDLSSRDISRSVTESAYLVLWRQEDHVMGFVYRSRTTVDIEALIGEAPRLIVLARGAVAGDQKDELDNASKDAAPAQLEGEKP